MEPKSAASHDHPLDTPARALDRIEKMLAVVLEQHKEMSKAFLVLSERGGAPAAPQRGEAGAAPGKPAAGADPLAELARTIVATPKDPKPYAELGNRLVALKRFAEAETVFRSALALAPRVAQSHTNLAVVLDRLGRTEEALACFRAALEVEPNIRTRKLLGELLLRSGKLDEAAALWDAEIEVTAHDPVPLHEAMWTALRSDRLEAATSYARRHAALRYGTRFWPEKRADDPLLARAFPPTLKAPKLRHDIEQLTYLREQGALGAEIQPMIDALERALVRVAPFGDRERLALNQEERRTLGALYGRIVHMAQAPRVRKALSYEWDMKAIEDEYVGKPPGIIYIDRLLSDEALESARRFCLESTIWSTSRYANGYLGSFVGDGFDAPLLVQIAEELRAAMPRVIGARPLTNMWGFTYDQEMDGINLHADPAAVNVNFWLTPDDANLDKESGGLVVYDVEAPQDWDFAMFNAGRPNEEIQEYLDRVDARAVNIPYKQNRAVIFNSDLFHRTAPFRFKPGYTNRRRNVTMLYGVRSDQRLQAPRT